ncbi:MAG: acyl carrier protein [Lachnospiraceae bacterium]|nr:acyl carrier protein [Lachnospiraceae bacterium]
MLEKLTEIIADQLNVDAADIEPATSFKDDLSADSLDLYEIIMAIEEEYSIEIPSDDLNSIATVEDVMNYLKNMGVEE